MSGDRPALYSYDYEQSDSVAEIAKALCKVQAEIETVRKDAKNPHFRSSYATLASCVKAALPILSKHGICATQAPGGDGAIVAVTTQLTHESGEWMRSTLRMRPTKNDPQGVASAVTYARRNGFLAMICVAPEEDDDGNAASAPPKRAKPSASAKRVISAYEAVKCLDDFKAVRNSWQALSDSDKEFAIASRKAAWGRVNKGEPGQSVLPVADPNALTFPDGDDVPF